MAEWSSLISFTLQTQIVNSTSMRLGKQQFHQGCKYEARVRARVSVGQWSEWIPVASRQTEEGDKYN